MCLPCAARTSWIHLQRNKWDAFYSNFNMNLHYCFTCKLSPRYTVHLSARTITINYQLYELKINVSILVPVSAIWATAKSTVQWSSNVLPARQILTTRLNKSKFELLLQCFPVLVAFHLNWILKVYADRKIAFECVYKHWTQRMSAAYLQHCSIFNKCWPCCTCTSSHHCHVVVVF